MSPDQVTAWLDREYVPSVLGWAPEDVDRLGPLLGRVVPEEYQTFLAVLGHLHPQLYGYDYRLRTPEDHLQLQRGLLEWDEAQWDGAEQYPEFDRMMQSGLFLNTLGGFAVWYLLCDSPGPLSTQTWLEGDANGQGYFEPLNLFLDDLEIRMGMFEHRVRLFQELGGTLVYGRGGQVPLGRRLGPALVDLPQEGWRVDLSELQREQIRGMWQGTDL